MITAIILASSCSRPDRGPSIGGAPPQPDRRVWVASANPPTSAPVARAGGPLSIPDARRYMVALVNRDRATIGLPPVELDEGAPTRAGQRHAEDMAAHGFLGHWGTDGSVPEQRHTEAGGVDMVLENASCFTDEGRRTLDPRALIDPRDVEKTEAMFFNEVPPNDGHRRNILKPYHRRVGIGIAQPVATATELPVPCITQEFTDPYGVYAPVPPRARVGDALHVEGAITPPAVIAGVGLARVDPPTSLPVSEVNRRRSYPVPAPFEMYWPPGFVTPIPLQVMGQNFRVDVPLSDHGKPGMYAVSVWAKMPGSSDNVMVGLRTIHVIGK